jgi:hypothetical protein
VAGGRGFLTLGAAALLGLAACGGDAEDADTGVPCIDEDPGRAATYANRDVAIGRDRRRPEGAELESDRSGGELPWFAKTALYVRGNHEVVVRVPAELSGVVRIAGWGEDGGEPRDAALVRPTSCPGDWTAYPGGLVFRGRHCVRLQVEGPGDAQGSVLVGLRRDCPAR